jgi:outer membrane protein, multidrug efflux system
MEILQTHPTGITVHILKERYTVRRIARANPRPPWLMPMYFTVRVRGRTGVRVRLGKALCLAAMIGQITACASGLQTPAEAVSAAQAQVTPAQWQRPSSTPVNEMALVTWWSQFGDATLTQLVEQSLAANNDIAAARGRLRSARAALDEAQGARLPSVNASGSAARQDNIDGLSRGEAIDGVLISDDTYSIGIDASWEADIFGKLRGTAEAASAGVRGSEASLYDVQRMITAEVALNYVDLRDAQARLQLAQANLDIQRENLQIALWRNQAGLANELDVEQARTAVGQTTAALPVLRLSIATAIQQIDVLTGKAPGSSVSLLSAPAALPAPPDIIDVGLPADLLQRRPDVLSAQASLETEVIRIGVAQADLYPALRLSGSIDTSSDSLSDLFNTSMGSVFAGVTAPIFQGGQIRARIEQQKGSADTALANYRSTVLSALFDVENALQSAKTAHEREAALAEAEQSALNSLQLAEIRYRAGAVDFQTLLDTQRSVLTVQDSRASASAARSTAAIQLFKALGGGWPDSAKL